MNSITRNQHCKCDYVQNYAKIYRLHQIIKNRVTCILYGMPVLNDNLVYRNGENELSLFTKLPTFCFHKQQHFCPLLWNDHLSYKFHVTYQHKKTHSYKTFFFKKFCNFSPVTFQN